MDDLFKDYFQRLGEKYDRMIRAWSIEQANCMVRYNDGPQLPAIRRDMTQRGRGKGNGAAVYKFFTLGPREEEIATPTSYEMMTPSAIRKLMDNRGEVYIGHMF